MINIDIIVLRGDIVQVIMDNRLIDGIPVNEYFLPNVSKYKGVFFMMHGHTSSKDYGTGLFPKRLAELGYFAVTVDAYKHGLRKQEPYLFGNYLDQVAEMPFVIHQTVQDIAYLYTKEYSHISEKVSIMGVSMGAIIAWQLPKYLSNIAYVVALIGTPDFSRLYDEKTINQYHGSKQSELIEMVRQLDIHDSITKYRNVDVYCANGIKDTLVNYHHTDDFISKHQKEFLTKPVLKLYDTSHDTPQEMIDDLFAWLKSKGE